jgi:hypothetical protein
LKPQHVFYLHGFASSPKSTKVGYFSERLHEHGVDVRCPDFNQPDFATLTMTRMLEQRPRRCSARASAAPWRSWPQTDSPRRSIGWC